MKENMRSRPFDTCKLCLKKKELLRSHIIPEFMYLDLYDEKHRAIKVDSNLDSGEPYIQKGQREFLLCDTCESHLATFENYAAPLVKSLHNLTAEYTADRYIVRDVDYKTFKLFQMSILWRSSVASIAMFKNVSLGMQEERL